MVPKPFSICLEVEDFLVDQRFGGADPVAPASLPDRLAAHLRDCPTCRDLRGLIERLGPAPDPGSDYWDRFTARLETRLAGVRPEPAATRRRLPIWLPWAAALAIGTAAGIAWLVGPGSPSGRLEVRLDKAWRDGAAGPESTERILDDLLPSGANSAWFPEEENDGAIYPADLWQEQLEILLEPAILTEFAYQAESDADIRRRFLDDLRRELRDVVPAVPDEAGGSDRGSKLLFPEEEKA